MQAVADTTRLVDDGIITRDQARTIEARARETMVYLAVNLLLCGGIAAATGGLILWLGTPASVAGIGLLFLALGVLILIQGNTLYGMFGNAAALIGAGMLIGGASIELIENHADIAGAVMTASGLVVAVIAVWLLRAERNSARFATGAALLMGLAMHLTGIAFLLNEASLSGLSISAFYLYATAVVVAAGWITDVRLVTALAIVPFAQALDTGTFYFYSAYVFYSPEPTLSILQMALLVWGCLWIAARQPEHTARHARVLGVMAFVVANLCALVGSLWGDYIGESFWRTRNYPTDMDWTQYRQALDAFRETTVFLSANLYSVLWAAVLAALVLWSAHRAQRGLFNAALTFAGLHAYTQFFETFYDEPLAYVIGGMVAIPLAWAMWRLDHWIVARRGPVASPQG